MSPEQLALETSVARLRLLVEPLGRAELVAAAYPSEWTIAQTLSHIGSGAVIMRAGLEAAVAGTTPPEGFNQSVWDEWNAKSPTAQAADALEADRRLVETIAGTTDEQRSGFTFPLGPFTSDFAGFLGLRLNEHALHTWDIEVVAAPGATVPSDAAAVMLDHLDLAVRFGSRSDGNERTVVVATTDPARHFTLGIGAEAVSLTPTDSSPPAGLTMPAESFVRLLFGRLDAAHTPAGIDEYAVGPLRAVFPGI